MMASKKRNIDDELRNSKRKHVALTILQKVEILQKLDNGTTATHISNAYGIGISTVYEIKKNKEKILKFYSKSDTNKGIADQKTLHAAHCENFDAVIYEWFQQRRSEGMPISGLLLREKAKEIHKKLNIKEKCEFSAGWLRQFKKRHGIRYLKACGEKISADEDAAEEFIDDFCKMVSEENLSPEQIYNLDETSLFWRCLPRKTLVLCDENSPDGIKESKERVTVMLCSNAAGTHKCTPLVVGKSHHPRAFKHLTSLPVIYKSNKTAWMTRELTTDWFKNNFLKEAQNHCKKVGLAGDCKIMLHKILFYT